ncbi:MAG: hypothetical protein ABH867_01995 [Patescibacteria group bacterium]
MKSEKLDFPLLVLVLLSLGLQLLILNPASPAGRFKLLTFGGVFAVNMESDSYRIQWGNINISGGKPSSTNYNLGITMGQISPGLYTGTGYKVRSGFQYVHSIHPFRFTISDLAIDLGSLSPQTPSTDTNTLTISTRGAGGYQILAYENHKLQSGANYITDTICDNGNCDETNAEIWTENTTYGFGFNINGGDVPADFATADYFRQFADEELNESHQTVMSNNGVVTDSSALVTYKANISHTQAAGEYETSVVFVAVPGY